jgi:hypothetical protein
MTILEPYFRLYNPVILLTINWLLPPNLTITGVTGAADNLKASKKKNSVTYLRNIGSIYRCKISAIG